MEYFSSITDKDIFDDPLPEPKQYIDRPTVKGLVFNKEDKIALLWHPAENFGLLPGGGIDDAETPEEAFIRECKEEIGCDVKIESKIGTAIQLRAKDARRYEVHFFVGRVVGDTYTPTTTQEDELSIETKWMTVSEIKSQLEAQARSTSPNWYQRQFNSRTHYEAFKKFLTQSERLR
jgi:8-oxo-dGTP diphosphatase